MPKQRPLSVTLLTFLVLCLTAWGGVRLLASIRWQNVLSEFNASTSPWYLSTTGMGWLAIGTILLFGLITVKKWAHTVAAYSSVIWLIEYWLERLFFQTERANLPFTIFFSVIGLIVVFITAFSPATKSFYTQSEEHEQPIETPTSE